MNGLKILKRFGKLFIVYYGEMSLDKRCKNFASFRFVFSEKEEVLCCAEHEKMVKKYNGNDLEHVQIVPLSQQDLDVGLKCMVCLIR